MCTLSRPTVVANTLAHTATLMNASQNNTPSHARGSAGKTRCSAHSHSTTAVQTPNARQLHNKSLTRQPWLGVTQGNKPGARDERRGTRARKHENLPGHKRPQSAGRLLINSRNTRSQVQADTQNHTPPLKTQKQGALRPRERMVAAFQAAVQFSATSSCVAVACNAVVSCFAWQSLQPGVGFARAKSNTPQQQRQEPQ